MDLQVLKTLSLFTLLQSAIWIVFLCYYKQGNGAQRKLLIALFSVFILYVTGSMFLAFGKVPRFYSLAELSNLSIFAVLPLFYLYLKNPKEGAITGIATWGHFIPLILLLVTTVLLLYTTKIDLSYNHSYSVILIGLFYVQCIVYWLLISRNFEVKAFTLKAFREKKNKDAVSWLAPFIYGFAILIFLKLSAVIVWNLLGLHYFCVVITSVFLIVSFILINSLILFVLLKKEHLLDARKYRNSTIKNADEYFDKFQDLIIRQKLYRDPLLNIDSLSKKMMISSSRLSQIINEKSGKNFKDLVNSYKVEDAKKLLETSTLEMNIIQIAYEVGFNSKTTFNTSFKKYTGYTPSQYRKQIIMNN